MQVELQAEPSPASGPAAHWCRVRRMPTSACGGCCGALRQGQARPGPCLSISGQKVGGAAGVAEHQPSGAAAGLPAFALAVHEKCTQVHRR